MNTSKSLINLLVFFAIASPVVAQTKIEIDQSISQVESGLMPAIRFGDEALWSLESRMKHYNVPGLSIAVIKDSKIIWSKGYGYADIESKKPVSSKTLFQAGSISKPVTAYAVLKELERGKLNPSIDINTFLKSWTIPANENTKESKVSIQNILSHTAGLTVAGFDGYERGTPIPSLLQILGGQSPANSKAIMVNKVPGKSFRYSGGGYTVLQQLLIDLKHKDFETIMKETVPNPLAMTNSTFSQSLTEIQARNAATAYHNDGTEVKGKYHIYPELAAAGLWTTAEDLAKYVIDIQNTLNNKSHKVISKKTAAEFTSPFKDPFVGLGMFLDNKKGQVYFIHGGINEGFQSLFVGSKTSGDGVVILTNTNKQQFIDELVRSVANVYQWPNYVTAANKKLPMTDNDLSDNTGNYTNDKYSFYKIYRDQNKLMMTYNTDGPIELFKVDENTYAMHEREFKIKVEKNEFLEIDQNGKVRSKSPKMAVEKQTPLEILLSGDFDAGAKAYAEAKANDSTHYLLSENYLNDLGLTLLKKQNFEKSINILRVNCLLYPLSDNVYDSLAEAYLKSGQKEKAKEYYQKTLGINPKHENAAQMLKIL